MYIYTQIFSGQFIVGANGDDPQGNEQQADEGIGTKLFFFWYCTLFRVAMRLVYSFLSETVIVGANGGIHLSDTDTKEHVEVESEADVNEESWEDGEAHR